MIKWSNRFLQLAALVATWSKDPSTQVGSVIADDKNRVLSVGFNGFPRKVLDSKVLYEDRDSKLNRTIHSEINAILFADSDKLPGSTLYVTAPPCVRCAVQIIQCGIEKVVCYAPSPKMVERWGDQMALAQELFREAEVIYLEHAHE